MGYHFEVGRIIYSMQKHLSLTDTFTILLVITLWGTAMSVAKIMFQELTPILSLTVRTILIGSLALCFMRKMPDKQTWKLLAIFTFTQMFMHQVLMWIALEHIDASTFTLLQQSGTLFSVLIGVFYLKENINLKTIIGIMICLIGLMVVFGTPNLQGQAVNIALVIICSFFGAISTLILKKMGKIDVATLLCIPSLLGFPIILIAGLFLESNQIQQLQDANWTKLGLILAYQVLFLNLAFILWQRILSRNSMTNVTPYLLLYPLFGVIFGIILLDEPLTSQLITGGALVIAGAGLMTLRFKQKSDKTKKSDNNPDDPEIYVEKIT